MKSKNRRILFLFFLYQSERLKNRPDIGGPKTPQALRPGHFMLPILLYLLICLFKSSPGNRLFFPVRKKFSAFDRISKRKTLRCIKSLALPNRNGIPQFILCYRPQPLRFRFPSPFCSPSTQHDFFVLHELLLPIPFSGTETFIHSGHKQIGVVSIIIDQNYKVNNPAILVCTSA